MSNISRSTVYGVNPKIPPTHLRPTCQTPGCNKHVTIISTLKDGSPNYRKWCSEHHNKRTAAKHGFKNMVEITAMRAGKTVSQYTRSVLEGTAKRKGFDTITEYLNSKHPYRYARKDFCENKDGRLGFKCKTGKMPNGFKGHLDVDHIDGNPANNAPENLQTLCSCCHDYKTWLSGDAKTAGRKALGITY